ncbi:acyl-CoA dehydrogenase family protein [Streptomyces sp. NPDC059766]|uniref:acyl-CoA dehydrogenase family protein n=1 Tax=Streptomyces sp. NPDC059766 TaxID=3346940 RepID=UPI00365FA202
MENATAIDIPVADVHTDDVLEVARRITPIVRAASHESERVGSMTPEIVELFKRTKLFWLLTPQELGGWGADIITTMKVLEMLSRADASAGWSLMANVNSTGFIGGAGSEALLELIHGGPEQPIVAGMFAPLCRAERVDGGFMLGGSYSFGSGSKHANWLAAGALLADGDSSREIVYFAPRAEVNLKENWDVIGLVGTGSYDYEIPRRFVDEDLIIYRQGAEILRGQPSMRLDLPSIAAAGHAAVALGMGLQSIDELQKVLAARKPRAGQVGAADQQLFRHGFSLAEGRFRAARSYCYELFAEGLATVEGGDRLSELQIHRLRQVTTLVHHAAYEMADFAFTWSGSGALRAKSAMGRCFRDVRVAMNHIYVDPSTLTNASPLILASYASDEDLVGFEG